MTMVFTHEFLFILKASENRKEKRKGTICLILKDNFLEWERTLEKLMEGSKNNW